MSVQNKEGRSVKCPVCGKNRYFKPSYLLEGRRFCSMKCRNEDPRFAYKVKNIWKKSPVTVPGNLSGSKNPQWKGGKSTTRGYVLKYAPRHPNAAAGNKTYVLEHRLVAERFLGRNLRKDEIVHHANGNKADNRPENLTVMTRSEHSCIHGRR